MISVTSLFLRRLTGEWKYQYSLWKTAVDWVVALYLIVPAVLLGVSEYVSLLRTLPTEAAEGSFDWLLLFLGFYICLGGVRIFVEEADQLFLLQQTSLIKRLVRLSVAYSLLRSCLVTFVLFIVLSPFFLFQYGLSIRQIIVLGLYTVFLKVTSSLLRQRLARRWRGWRKRVADGILLSIVILYFRQSCALLVAENAGFLVFLAFLLVLMGVLLKKRLADRGSFFEDVERAVDEKNRYAGLLVQASGVSVRKVSTRSRSVIFRRSRNIFAKRTPIYGLVELSIKSNLRKSRNIGQYALIVALSILFMSGAPLGLKLLVWPVLAFVMIFFVRTSWRETLSSEFVQLFRFKPEDVMLAEKKFLFWLLLPGFSIISLCLGYWLYSWIGALLALLGGLGIAYLAVDAVVILGSPVLPRAAGEKE